MKAYDSEDGYFPVLNTRRSSYCLSVCLSMKKSKFFYVSLLTISSALSKHIEIKELYIASNNFQESGMAQLINVIPELSLLNTLSIGLSHINDAICTNLSGSLLSMTESNLQHLYLNGNEIGDEGLLSLM